MKKFREIAAAKTWLFKGRYPARFKLLSRFDVSAILVIAILKGSVWTLSPYMEEARYGVFQPIKDTIEDWRDTNRQAAMGQCHEMAEEYRDAVTNSYTEMVDVLITDKYLGWPVQTHDADLIGQKMAEAGCSTGLVLRLINEKLTLRSDMQVVLEQLVKTLEATQKAQQS